MSKSMKFETAIGRLTDIVREMEKGDTSLDEALTLFEEGVAMTKRCNTLLDEAEQKVTLLLKDYSGQVAEQAFVSGAGPEGE